ncbi:RagB/SusD family nutrient uptake outer membrane protein [Desertivirga xinjiangensis]|uniref:RagB/SusD family nutrient uptake outer membrane protein n=1 Tax=Desertivirga xinjiangensis TaxID=539206 RepID=UPI0021094753|nr:RagB/SusD family nutrient uptake outer membrane protein [Pedobacter xinjiangensis]
MKTKMKILIITLIISINISSCTSFLDLEPQSDLTTGNAYKSAADLEAALIGTYRTLYTDYFIWENFVMSDVRSDNAYAGGDDPEIYQYDNLAVSSMNSRILLTWRQLYNGIANANLVIEKAPQVSDIKLDTDNKRNKIIAEARFLRALFYFELVKTFGEIPIVKEFGKINPSEANVPKSSVADIYKFIIEDLDAALILPTEYGSLSLNKSKVTRGAVYALLAKVYAQKPDRDYNKVLEYCNEVGKLGYDLHGSYDQLFDGLNYNNPETILLVQYIAGTPEANWGPQLLLPPSLSGDDWRKYVTPSKDLLAAYDAAGDTQRKSASVLVENVEWADEFWKPCASSGSVPFPYKFRHANAWASGDNVYILRYDDILLLKAEALNELNRGSDALTPLNYVRDRVDLQAITTTDKEALKEIILNERRLELAFEGYRWDDLVRAGKAVSKMNSLQEFKLTCGGGSTQMNYRMSQEKTLMPIPQSELNRNPALNP